MSFDRKLVVEILAKLGTYVADLGTVATTTEVTAARVETSRSKIVAAAEQIAAGQSDMAATAVRATAAVGPLGAAMAAGAVVAGAFAVAHHKVAQETTNMVKALALSGNQAGVNTGQMHDMAEAVQGVGKTHAQAVGVLTEFAASGKVSATMMESLTATTLEAQRTLGLSADETVKRFASLADEPVKASLKLAESANHLTASTYARIKSLEEMGRKDLAAAEAQKAYQVQLDEASARVNERLGTVQKAWRGAGEMAAWAWDRFLDLGREQTSGEKLGAVAAEIRNLEAQIALRGSTTGGTRFDRETLALKEQLLQLREKQGLLQDDARLNQRIATAQAEQAALVQAMGEWDKKGEQYLTKQAKMEAEIAAERRLGVAAKKSEADIEERIAAIRSKYADKAGGKKDSFIEGAEAAKEWAQWIGKANGALNESEAHMDGLTKSQKLLNEYLQGAYNNENAEQRAAVLERLYKAVGNEQAAIEIKKQAEAWKLADKAAAAYGKQLDDIAMAGMDLIAQANERTAAVEEMVAATEFEASLMGRTNSERAVALKQYQIELDLKRQIAKINESIASQEDKDYAINAAKNAANRAKANAAAEVVNAEFERVSQQIEQSLTDALMRGFENGKDFAANLRDTVANMFKTLVLRPIVSAIVNPVAGAITGGLGLAGTANAATGAGSLASGAGLLGALGSGLGAGASMIAGGGIGGWLSASTSLIGTGTAAGAMAGMGALAGPIGAVLAIGSLLKSLDDSGTAHTGGLGGYSAALGSTTGDAVKTSGLNFDLASKDYSASATQAAAAMAMSVVGMLDSTANTFGQQAGYYAATAFADDSSRSGAWGALMLKLGDKVLIDWQQGADKWPGREFADGEAGAKEYAAAIAVAVRDQLITQVPAWADAALQALGDAPTLEQLGVVVGQINAAAAAMDGMGRASAAFAGQGDAAVATLIKALGGADAAAARLGSYYTDFYSEAERTAIATSQLTAQLAELGVAMPAGRDAYKALVDAAVAAGDATLAAKLIGLGDAFADLVPAATDATAAAQAAAAASTSALRSAVDREKALWRTQAEAASALRDEVNGVFATLADGVQALRAQGLGVQGGAAQAQQFIERALAAALATGALPDGAALADAIGAVQAGISGGQYGSETERQYAALVWAGQLEALQGVAGEQLTEAERQYRAAQTQIDQLDKTLDYWQQQVELSQGNIDATASVADAIAALQEALKPGSTGAAKATAAARQPIVSPTGDSMDAYRSSLAGVAEYDTANWVNLGGRYVNISSQTMASPEDYYAARLQAAYWSPEADMAETFAQLSQSSFAGNPDMLLTLAKAAGLDQAIVDSYAKEFLPKLSTGTNYVPQDGAYYLHQGEAVQPVAYNPAVGGGVSEARFVAVVQGFTAEIATLRAAIEVGNAHQFVTASKLSSAITGNAMNTAAVPELVS